MECFTHNTAQSIGICKTCSKAVCHSCVIDSSIFITCSEICKKEAADMHEMTQRGKKLYGIGVPKKIASGVIMWCLFGTLFGGFGIFRTIESHQPDWFLLLFGGLSLFIACLAYKRAKESGLQC
jgi:hypothetical protein